MSKIAVCPGSFDPITLGHLDVILRAKAIFGKVEVVVMNNREKLYRFTPAERLAMAKAALEEYEGVEVSFYEGMLYDFLGERDAVIVKGIRNETDYLYERNQAEFNLRHSGKETLYLDASPEFRQISSTEVRRILEEKGELSEHLPPKVIKLLQNKL